MKLIGPLIAFFALGTSFGAEDQIPRLPNWTYLCNLELRLPGRDAPILLEAKFEDRFSRLRRKAETGEDGLGVSFNALNLMLANSFVLAEKAGPHLTVRFEEKPSDQAKPRSGSFTASLNGLAESAYALKMLLSHKDFAQWVETQLKPEPNAAPIVALKSIFGNEWPDDLQGSEEEQNPKEALLKAARATYDSRRAELIAQFAHSYLFYPAAEKFTWSVKKKGETRWASVGCAYLMFAARFLFQMELQADGQWKCVKIYGAESFKGE